MRTSNQRTHISYEQFNDTLRNLQEVTWRPYLRISPDKIPEKYYANFKRAVASTILVSFYMVAFHKLEFAPLQFKYRSARQYRYPSLPNSNVKKGPKKNIDLATVDPMWSLLNWIARGSLWLEKWPVRHYFYLWIYFWNFFILLDISLCWMMHYFIVCCCSILIIFFDRRYTWI